MALRALSQVEHESWPSKSRMADLMAHSARGEARVACQGEGAAVRQGVEDGGWHFCGGVKRVRTLYLI